jgi:hypothetical protein
MVVHQEARLKAIEGMEGKAAERGRQDAQAELKRAKEALKERETYCQDVLGYVLFAPDCTRALQDRCLTLQRKHDRPKIMPADFKVVMHSHPMSPKSFTYLPNRLLTLKGTTAEMCRPTMLDQDSEPCLIRFSSEEMPPT